MKSRRLAVLLLVASPLVTGLGACSSDSSSDASSGGTPATTTDGGATLDEAAAKAAKEAMTTYVALAHERYATSLDRAKALRDAVSAFLAAPSQESLDAARAAWIAARAPYGETESFRFFGGPIDDDDGPEGRVNAWPLDEAFIDYTSGAPDAGIVNHPTEYPAITKEVLEASNEKDGEANIATGYHAIEFLLWGQDLSDVGAGARPFTDYTAAPNAERRKEYLRVGTNLLVDDLTFVADAWDPAKAGSYGQAFAAAPIEGVAKAFKGIVMLSGLELSRERMDNAFQKGDQEEEHSCFSDNTTADLVANATAIENVYLRGGLTQLVAAKDAAKDADVKSKLTAALDAVKAIPAPFDRAIVDLESRPKVKAAIDAVKALTDALIAAATAIGVTVDVAE